MFSSLEKERYLSAVELVHRLSYYTHLRRISSNLLYSLILLRLPLLGRRHNLHYQLYHQSRILFLLFSLEKAVLAHPLAHIRKTCSIPSTADHLPTYNLHLFWKDTFVDENNFLPDR